MKFVHQSWKYATPWQLVALASLCLSLFIPSILLRWLGRTALAEWLIALYVVVVIAALLVFRYVQRKRGANREPDSARTGIR